MTPARRLLPALFSAVLTVSACTGNVGAPTGAGATRKPGVAVTPKATPPAPVTGQAPGLLAAAPRPIAQTGAMRLIAGEVKLISDLGAGLVSDQGAGIISNNTGGLISNNSGSIVSNNAGGIVSNNAGGLIGNNAGGYHLAQTAGSVELRLADADISVHDAQGRILTDVAGKPITAHSDATGQYKLEGVLPNENLVLKIKLWNGGQLSAILPKDGTGAAKLSIDTAATLGATYVLTQFVKGDQATFDKLPAGEAERLNRVLAEARALITTTPTYQPAALVTLADELRLKQPTVQQALEDIKVLLLGGLGDGKPATQVALNRPTSLFVEPDGTLLIGEQDFGRVRRVAPDGTLSTWIDGAAGTIKRNIVGLSGLARGADGSYYFASNVGYKVYKLSPAGVLTDILGTGPGDKNSSAEQPATAMSLRAHKLAMSPSGTLYVSEYHKARVVSVDAAGIAHEVVMPPDTQTRDIEVSALAVAADGSLWMLVEGGPDGGGLYKRSPAGAWTRTLGVPVLTGDLALDAEGTLFVLTGTSGELFSLSPAGVRTQLAGGQAPPAGSPTLVGPTAVAVGPDKSVYISDRRSNLVQRRLPDGSWVLAAGVLQGDVTDENALTFNSPGGVVFDALGRMLVTEAAGHTIKRWDGKTLSTIAGTIRGFGGDGGPATQALFDSPSGLAFRGDELLVMDARNNRLRGIAADGTIRTLVGGPTASMEAMAVGETRAAAMAGIKSGAAVVVAPDGSIYWTAANKDQIQGMRAGTTTVDLIAGRPLAPHEKTNDHGDGGPGPGAGLSGPTSLAFVPGTDGDALVVADTVNLRVRKITGLKSGQPRIEALAGMSREATVVKLLSLEAGTKLQEEGIAALDAVLMGPSAVCFDAAGNLYIAEAGTAQAAQLVVQNENSANGTLPLDLLPKLGARLRKVTPDGRITTVAGEGSKLFTDPDAADGLGLTTSMTIDPLGRLVMTDVRNNAIRILPKGSF